MKNDSSQNEPLGRGLGDVALAKRRGGERRDGGGGEGSGEGMGGGGEEVAVESAQRTDSVGL